MTLFVFASSVQQAAVIVFTEKRPCAAVIVGARSVATCRNGAIAELRKARFLHPQKAAQIYKKKSIKIKKINKMICLIDFDL